MAKITLATVKSFMKKNEGKLFVKAKSGFDGMVDCVMPIEGSSFKPAQSAYNPCKNNFGLQGVWFVFGGDSCSAYEDDQFIGFNVWNCCGEFNIAVKKAA